MPGTALLILFKIKVDLLPARQPVHTQSLYCIIHKMNLLDLILICHILFERPLIKRGTESRSLWNRGGSSPWGPTLLHW